MAVPDFALRSEGDDGWLLFAQSDAARAWARAHLPAGGERRGSALLIGTREAHALVYRLRRAGLRVEVVAPALRRWAVQVGARRSASRFA
jgi:hypothetical protein